MSDLPQLISLLLTVSAVTASCIGLYLALFNTASGYRKCQESVLGLWAQKTMMCWRWSSFKFETIYYVPHISYQYVHSAAGTKYEALTGVCALVDTPESRQLSMIFPDYDGTNLRNIDSDELACWIPLMAQLHIQGKQIVTCFPPVHDVRYYRATIPTIRFIRKSWDLQAPDAIKPLAVAYTCDVAIMGRRLGMTWKEFNPGGASLRAEGNGHVFISCHARSIGLVLQYFRATTNPVFGYCCYIPVRAADKLGFGLVELDHRLFATDMMFDLDVGSYEGITRSLPLFMSKEGYSGYKGLQGILRNFSRAFKAGSDFIPGFNDLVPICSSMLNNNHPSGSWTNRIPAPNLLKKGVTYSREGFWVFENRLEKIVAVRGDEASKQACRVLELVKSLREVHKIRWEFEAEWDIWKYRTLGNDVPAPEEEENTQRDLLISYHHEMTTFLYDSVVSIRELIVEHMVTAAASGGGGLATPTEQDYMFLKDYDLDDLADAQLAQSMAYYFDELPELVSRVQRRHRLQKDHSKHPVLEGDIEDAWFSMMLRAFCWQRCHVMIAGIPPLPSDYWNSKMPVFIG